MRTRLINNAIVAFGVVVAALSVSFQAAAANPPNLTCIGSFSGGSYNNVTVPAGDSLHTRWHKGPW